MNEVSVAVARYGVREQVAVATAVDKAIESLRLLGFAVLDGGYSTTQLDAFSAAFDEAHAKLVARYGLEYLTAIDEHNTIRAMLGSHSAFIELASNRFVLDVCRRLIGGAIMLNQQNGIVNPANNQRYNQGSYHRDLPYQHFVSSRPLAINALFCLDAFTPDNGATRVLPATHKQEEFPSDAFIQAIERQVTAPRGSFILLDCMTYHSGSPNRSAVPRRAVNHVYTIPLLKQQISLPDLLGEDFTGDEVLRKLLGYPYKTPTDLSAYYKNR